MLHDQQVYSDYKPDTDKCWELRVHYTTPEEPSALHPVSSGQVIMFVVAHLYQSTVTQQAHNHKL